MNKKKFMNSILLSFIMIGAIVFGFQITRIMFTGLPDSITAALGGIFGGASAIELMHRIKKR